MPNEESSKALSNTNAWSRASVNPEDDLAESLNPPALASGDT